MTQFGATWQGEGPLRGDDASAAIPSAADAPAIGPRGAGAAPADGPRVDQPVTAAFHSPTPVDLRLTLAPLGHGPSDPAFRLRPDEAWLARRTDRGGATLRLRGDPDFRSAITIVATAWGPGAADALDAVPGLAGLLDDPSALVVASPLLRDLQRRHAGLRLPRSGQLVLHLAAAVTEQKVTGTEAHAAWAGLLRGHGELAPYPGPAAPRLRLPPTTAILASIRYFELHRVGLERRRAEVLAAIGRRGAEIETLTTLAPGEAMARLQRIPGIGPWSAAEAVRLAFGDPDAVSVADAHLPDLVAWALAREPRGDDARMLELLAPYAGQRARVARLLEVSRIEPPRRGPRFSPRDIRGL